MKYRKPIFLIIIYYLFIPIMLIWERFFALKRANIPGYWSFFPFNNNYLDQLIFIYLLLPIVAIILALFFSYLLAPLLLSVHKIFIGNKKIYGIEEYFLKEDKKFNKNFRGFYPSLMAINFSFYLTSYLWIILMNKAFSKNEDWIAMGPYLCFSQLMLFTLGPSLGLFMATWLLDEAGIVYSNKSKNDPNKTATEIQSIGTWYRRLFTFYAGISVIFTFYSFWLLWMGRNYNPNLPLYHPSLVWNFMNIIVAPFFYAFACLPTIIILDKMKEGNKRFIRNIAKKFGIREKVEISFELIK